MSNEELDLLNEMKENCLKKGQYIDEKAKDKFNMLCHCEDFIIENYEQRKEIERLKERIDKAIEYINNNKLWERIYEPIIPTSTTAKIESKEIILSNKKELLKILKGEDKE